MELERICALSSMSSLHWPECSSKVQEPTAEHSPRTSCRNRRRPWKASLLCSSSSSASAAAGSGAEPSSGLVLEMWSAGMGLDTSCEGRKVQPRRSGCRMHQKGIHASLSLHMNVQLGDAGLR